MPTTQPIYQVEVSFFWQYSDEFNTRENREVLHYYGSDPKALVRIAEAEVIESYPGTKWDMPLENVLDAAGFVYGTYVAPDDVARKALEEDDEPALSGMLSFRISPINLVC